METNRIYNEDNAITMNRINDNSIGLILTSPPYNIKKEYDKELELNDYLNTITRNISEYYRILNNAGSICFQVGNYINNGAVYPLDCLLFNSFVKAGFIPRGRIVWTFGHGMHAQKRFSGRYETILWFTKGNNYKFNLDPVRVPQKFPQKKFYRGDKKGQLSCNPLGKNPSDVWDISNVKHGHPEKTEHPCQFPGELAARCILSLTDEGDIVYDPYIGSGTTAAECIRHNRLYIGSEMKESYINIIDERIIKEYSWK